MPSETVDHPKHYNLGRFEVIDVIDDWQLNFSLGCVVKYVARVDAKGSAIEDLKKARWYLSHEIERRERERDERRERERNVVANVPVEKGG